MTSVVDLEALSRMSLEDLEATLTELSDHRKYNKIDFFQLYPKQREFIAMGAGKQERMLFAGNQLGKSYVGAYETACHLTGIYPKDWPGRKWGRPVKGWACGVSSTVTRDVSQTLLCGEPGVETEFGVGFIPRHCFVERPSLARGAVADSYDTVQVWHHTDGVRDGISMLQFKSYEQGRPKFQGRTLDFVWWDEEPPADVYGEGNTRWSATAGMSYMTFTPLFGYSDVVCRFLRPDSTEPLEYRQMRGHLTMGYRDAFHMTEDMVKSNLAKYPRHEHAARMNGEPLLGSGAVHIFDPALVTFKSSYQIPLQFAKLWGIDFGITHPFAAVLIAWDREIDLIYVVAGYRAPNATPLVHSEAIRNIAAEVPIAWPHDGHAREKGSGEQVASQYRKQHLKMLATHATYPEGGFSTEAAVMEVDTRLEKGNGPGGMVIREDFREMFEELREYHRKDGLLVKERDDLISALHKALMMKRFARPVPLGARPRPEPGAIVRPARAAPINPFTGAALY